MKKSFTKRDAVMLVFLIALVVSLIYYMGFYTPLQDELRQLSEQAAQLDSQIAGISVQVNKMNAMQAELDEIFQRPAEEITEIAPYDNKDAVLTQLYTILAQTQDYSLSFTDPNVGSDGTVRRNISMNFHCDSYIAAKDVLKSLTESRWRCLVSNVSISGDNADMITNGVTVSATITFFEHTGLSK